MDDEINFADIFSMLKKNVLWLVVFFLLIVGGVTYYTFTVDPLFEAKATVVVSAEDTSFGVLKEESRRLDVFTEVSIIESSVIMSPLIQTYGKFDHSVIPVKNSNLIEITVRYPNPILVRTIANEIAQSYITYTKSVKEANAHDVISILKEQVVQAESELNAINTQLFSFEQKKARDFSEEYTYVLLQQQISREQDEYTYLVRRKRALEELLVSSSASAGEKSSARDLLGVVEADLLRVEDRIASLQSDMLAVVFKEKLSSEEEIQYLGLLQSKSVKEQQLVQVLSRLETVSIAQQTAYASVVDLAVTPEDAVSPNIMLNLLVGLVLGVVGAFGLVYIKEMIRGTVTSVSDLERVTGSQVIGDLPKVKGGSYLVQHNLRQGVFAEKMRMLRTNVLFALQESKNKLVVVTSSSKSDGKTTTAINLAISLAHHKQRVLLIDANVRHPQLQDVFKSRQKVKGLTDVISGDVKVSDVISGSAVPNLDIMFSGSVNDYPWELFVSHELVDLLEGVKKKYDVIVLDAPSCEFAEVNVLGRVCEFVLFVVKHDRTKMSSLEQATKTFFHKLRQDGTKEKRNINISLVRNFLR